MTISEEAVKAAQNAIRTTNWEYGITDADMAKALTAALPFLPVQGAVKKLEWDEDGCAKTPFGMYTVAENAEDTWSFTFYDYPYGIPEGEFGTLDEAKAAAQADYEARIRSAIETVIPVSQPSAARSLALEEAVRKHLKWFERFICDHDELNSSTPRKVAQNAQDAAAELSAALSSPDHADAGKVEGDGWLPIESAPKDGTRILAAGMRQGPAIEIVSYGSFGPYNRSTKEYAKGWSCIPGHLLAPTHWRPLPSAPASEGAE